MDVALTDQGEILSRAHPYAPFIVVVAMIRFYPFLHFRRTFPK